MHFILWLQSLFCLPPSTILTITTKQATLTSLKNLTSTFASVTVKPSLLTDDYHLTGGFQLRTFIDVHLPLSARRPFCLIVQLPVIPTEQAQRLATHVTAILLALKMPPAVITQDNTLTTPTSALKCIFFNQPLGYIRTPRWWIVLISLLICMASGTAYWYTGLADTTPVPLPPPPITIITKAKPRTPVWPIIIAALLADKRSCVLLKAQGKNNTHTVRFVAPDPTPLLLLTLLFKKICHTQWHTKAPTYKWGFPPLYYSVLKQESGIQKASA